jgi:stearoyl-CoA desaturase (delta-9 desaturase)
VLLPALREEASQAGDSLRRLPRRLRKGLADDDRWLDAEARARLQAFIAHKPKLATLVEYRARLAAVLEERSHDAGATLQRLQEWCREAEASGIRALEEFAGRLRGYALAPARA